MIRIANETTAVTKTTAGCRWEHWTDEDLLLEYRCTGIREAFEKLVCRYEKELYNFLYHQLGNAANAEDVFQKTFLTVLEECGKFDSSRKFRPWLYRIAANKAADFHRKNKRYTVVSIDAQRGDDADDIYSLADMITDNEPGPFEESSDRETANMVREAVEALPETMRQAVYMIYFQGMSNQEAAEIAGVHCSTLTLRVQKAVSKLNFLLRNVG